MLFILEGPIHWLAISSDLCEILLSLSTEIILLNFLILSLFIKTEFFFFHYMLDGKIFTKI